MPNLIIIGAQKSASTFMQNAVAEHPDVFIPKGEEAYFEDPDYDQKSASYLSGRFDGRNEKILGIKRPNYIGKPEVPARIVRDLPDAKIIAVLRNPVDRAIAAYFHQIRYGTMPLLPLDEGMSKLVENDGVIPGYARSKEILEFGLYYKYLSQYEHFSSSGRQLVFLHEDISKEPEECIRKSYEFLGVDVSYSPQNLQGRPMAAVYNPLRLKVLAARNPLMFTYNDDRTRLHSRKMNYLEYGLAGALTVADRYVLSRFLRNNKPQLDPTIRKKMVNYFLEDIRKLEKLIDRDLSAWMG
ncbi:hypothetical protein ATO3_02560 [Marinibacterium profundimaris]|uniref:Sulfotransferase domain-containing protein n=2 Tax=Marinibacterium profundimaris TaxID=1679460 RepID=A0A225NRZ9_9RHOB|nr:hypothetical protein ATO3_02560 [Marinibacterium profundimaris]